MHDTESGINLDAEPSGEGCVECLKADGWWLHLRRCAQCGHIGCCDSSPSQHASRHFRETGHPVIANFEPDDAWFYDYRSKRAFDGPALKPPLVHPLDQPTPGPHGKVPRNWEDLLH